MEGGTSKNNTLSNMFFIVKFMRMPHNETDKSVMKKKADKEMLSDNDTLEITESSYVQSATAF